MTSLQLLNLDRLKVEQDLNNVIKEHFFMLSEHENQVCKKCGVIQGRPNKGFNKYYCRHLTEKIDNKLKKEKERICENLIHSLFL